MKSQPKAVVHKLKPNSVTQDMVEEVAERVLRDLAPEQPSRYFPDLQLTREKVSQP